MTTEPRLYNLFIATEYDSKPKCLKQNVPEPTEETILELLKPHFENIKLAGSPFEHHGMYLYGSEIFYDFVYYGRDCYMDPHRDVKGKFFMVPVEITEDDMYRKQS